MAGVITVVALVVFIASFAFSIGPVVWTVISEIFPNRVRGHAVSLATAANWGAAFLVTQFFLTIVDAIGESTTFFLFAAMCVVSYVWIHRNVPETRGQLARGDPGSLEPAEGRCARSGRRRRGAVAPLLRTWRSLGCRVGSCRGWP